MRDKTLAEIERRMDEIEASVFHTPPADWAGFKERQGHWLELQSLKQWVVETIRNPEEDDHE